MASAMPLTTFVNQSKWTLPIFILLTAKTWLVARLGRSA